MPATIDKMPRSKKPKVESPTSRHKPTKQYRVPLHLSKLLDEVAEAEWTTAPTQLILAVRYYLIHKGKLESRPGESGSPS